MAWDIVHCEGPRMQSPVPQERNEREGSKKGWGTINDFYSTQEYMH